MRDHYLKAVEPLCLLTLGGNVGRMGHQGFQSCMESQ
ncbi:hypothetical protein FHW18_003627 [Pigmentiphaga litoralis]|uniref:Uncharacterized protein n=1 Tax=Pigmentiphaga litoralis TaxID=516702 RepID=A0A7Y9IWG6_9BURK|nr:hypothetical protein [Pigmentiphaga litoralis]NYE84356.1 hypothetical protein [Pigmentiphaga litoralis]